MNQIKSLLVILLILVLGFAVYLILHSDLLQNNLEGSEMIPPDAVMVYETNDPVGMWNTVVGQPVWEKLHQLPLLSGLEAQLVQLDSLTGKSGILNSYLKGQEFRLSLHPLGRENFGFMVSIAFKNRDFLDFIQNFKNENQGDPVKVRTYSGVNLFELNLGEGQRVFTYAIYNNVLVGILPPFCRKKVSRHADPRS